MEVCSINDLLPYGKTIKKIVTGSELLFAYELDKYARLFLDKKISLKGVTISKVLYSQAEFSFVVTHGLDVGFEVVHKYDTLMDISSKRNTFFTDTVQGVELKSKTDTEWVYDFDFNIKANSVCYGMSRSAAYVSLVAFMIIHSLEKGVKCPKLIIDHEKYAELSLEYVDLLILQMYGNKLLKDLVEIRFNPYSGNQPTVEAFFIQNRQRGFMNREYTVNEKLKMFKKLFNIGDVVLLYNSNKSTKSKTLKLINSCYPATITGCDDKYVYLTYYPNTNTNLTHSMLLSEAEIEYGEDAKTQGLITFDDYSRFPVCSVKYSLSDIGIDLYTYLENKFIIRPVDTDGTYQFFKTPQGFDRVFVDTIDTIYALYEDRGLWYDNKAKERFVMKYFVPKKKIPVYETYKTNNNVN